jgi:hypothetical protein
MKLEASSNPPIWQHQTPDTQRTILENDINNFLTDFIQIRKQHKNLLIFGS